MLMGNIQELQLRRPYSGAFKSTRVGSGCQSRTSQEAHACYGALVKICKQALWMAERTTIQVLNCGRVQTGIVLVLSDSSHIEHRMLKAPRL